MCQVKNCVGHVQHVRHVISSGWASTTLKGCRLCDNYVGLKSPLVRNHFSLNHVKLNYLRPSYLRPNHPTTSGQLCHL